jgi:hypothetical protein
MLLLKTEIDELNNRVSRNLRRFDLDCLHDLRSPRSPEVLLRESGRGIYLARAFMDEFHVQAGPAVGGTVSLIKSIRESNSHRNNAGLWNIEETRTKVVELLVLFLSTYRGQARRDHWRGTRRRRSAWLPTSPLRSFIHTKFSSTLARVSQGDASISRSRYLAFRSETLYLRWGTVIRKPLGFYEGAIELEWPPRVLSLGEPRVEKL